MRKATIRVLWIDDSPLLLNLGARLLRRDPDLELVGTAANGDEGLTLARKLHPDIVVTDLHMPDVSGFALIATLRKELPETGLIALTLYPGEAERDAAVAFGADEFVRKSHMTEELGAAIHRVANQKRDGSRHTWTRRPLDPPGPTEI